MEAELQPVESLIRVVRGHKVIIDSDLAALFEVETKRLNEAVKRNPTRFPVSFMFQVTREELSDLRPHTATSTFGLAPPPILRSQIATSKDPRGGRRYLPNVFTEHGVVMLSSVLNSPRAIQMSILVVNAFIRMRELIAAHRDLADRIDKLERGQDHVTSVVNVLAEDIDRLALEIHQLNAPPETPKRRIGFATAATSSAAR